MLTRGPRNPATYKQAVKGDKPGMWAYCASKVLAEKAVFEYAKKHPELQITTMNRKRRSWTMYPPEYLTYPAATMIFGPPEQTVSSTKSLNTSADMIYQLISSDNKELPPQGLPLFVYVRDVAQAHVLALKHDSVIGKRVLLSGGPYTLYDVSVLNPSLSWK